jgi:hypothetical protein
MNNNTNNQNKKTLSQTTKTTKGTPEQGALKTIHREYNKLNGYEAMLHIINRFRFVLYPFIFLSIAGSSYSYYNDFIIAFPMLSNTAVLTIAIFFSIMLEIVRDGSLIALFNGKMNPSSRLLVVAIFISVTTYMYSSHLKAIDVIEKSAVAYTLAHQDTKSQSVTNPKITMVSENLAQAKKDLKDTKEEYTKQLDISANAKYQVNKVNAQNQLVILKADKETYKKEVSKYQDELLLLQNSNIKNIEDSQKLISNILLATLLLIESLAMLGAVIKFISKDNADKEVAKHSEIVEEYIQISEQMKQDNEELTKQLSSSVQAQSQSNQAVMQLVTEDLKQSSAQNIQFIHAIAQNKNEIMQHMNEVLTMIATQPNHSLSSFNQQ